MNGPKLAIVTDIHHGEPFGTKYSQHALDLLAGVIDAVKADPHDLLLDLGDRINDADRESDLTRLGEVAAIFKRSNTPRAHLIGNHDFDFMDEADNHAILESPMNSRSLVIKGWRLVFWYPSARYHRTNGFNQDPGALEWLAEELPRDERPTVVFTHAPLLIGPIEGNYWFEHKPQAAVSPDADAARRILEASPNVVMAIAGHVHWNRLLVSGGVHYLTLQSLIDGFTASEVPSGTWATIHLGEQITVEVHGADRMKLELGPGILGRRWPVPRGRK